MSTSSRILVLFINESSYNLFTGLVDDNSTSAESISETQDYPAPSVINIEPKPTHEESGDTLPKTNLEIPSYETTEFMDKNGQNTNHLPPNGNGIKNKPLDSSQNDLILPTGFSKFLFELGCKAFLAHCTIN